MTAVFIDGEYLNRVLKSSFDQMKIDYHKFAVKMADPNEMFRTYYYQCLPFVPKHNPTDEDIRRRKSASGFHDVLRRLPRFQVRLGDLAHRGNDQSGNPIFVQKAVDVMLAVDMIQLSATRQISHAILVSGDSDFVPAVEATKQNGVIVTLWHGPATHGSGVHQRLMDICDERFEINSELLDDACLER